jgi:hypothetical protein
MGYTDQEKPLLADKEAAQKLPGSGFAFLRPTQENLP